MNLNRLKIEFEEATCYFPMRSYPETLGIPFPLPQTPKESNERPWCASVSNYQAAEFRAAELLMHLTDMSLVPTPLALIVTPDIRPGTWRHDTLPLASNVAEPSF